MIQSTRHHYRNSFPIVAGPLRIRASSNRQLPHVLRQGKLNGIHVTVLEDGVDHPSPACQHLANQELNRLEKDLLNGRYVLKELATGDTQISRYRFLTEGIRQRVSIGAFSWEKVARQTFWCHGDEMEGIDPKLGFCAYVLHKVLRPLADAMGHELGARFLNEQTFLIDPAAEPDVPHLPLDYRRCRDFDAFFTRLGSRVKGDALFLAEEIRLLPNLAIEVSLGMGPKGHILFNEADNGPFRHLPMGRIPLSQSTRQRQDASYDSNYSHAFTWRREIFWASHIDMIVTKANYADEVFRAFAIPHSDETQAKDFSPARELQTHPNVHLTVSQSAAARILHVL